jgi:hypothetical protein
MNFEKIERSLSSVPLALGWFLTVAASNSAAGTYFHWRSPQSISPAIDWYCLNHGLIQMLLLGLGIVALCYRRSVCRPFLIGWLCWNIIASQTISHETLRLVTEHASDVWVDGVRVNHIDQRK